ncbi:MAG: DNA repair protein RadC [Thermovirgaceae bacterium]|nr:DNA repair protein RadC [Thermovirgaceae bacterium]
MSLLLVPVAELPRERLENFGPQALSLAELLAILLRTGDRERNVLEAASYLLKEFGSLQGLARTSFHEFLKIGGLGKAKAASLVAALELAKRLHGGEKAAEESEKGETPRSCMARWSVTLAAESREFIVAVFADSRNRVIMDEKISWGGLDGAVLDMKFLLRKAIRLDASGVLLLHNHPDGSVNASVEDRLLTAHVERKLEALGIDFLGHYIAAGGVFSEVRPNAPDRGGIS